MYRMRRTGGNDDASLRASCRQTPSRIERDERWAERRDSVVRRPRVLDPAGWRRAAGVVVAVVALAAGGAMATAPEPFTFDRVIEQATALAERDYAPALQDLRPPFADLGYDQYRGIRMREDRQLWHGENKGFAVDLLPPGFLFQDRVEIAVVDDGAVVAVPFDAAAYDFDPRMFDPATIAAGEEASSGHMWTGLRLRHAINRAEVLDEVVVFHGASYFRAVARGLIYGLSARGLAIGTGSPQVEEFPAFTKFWLLAPAPNAGAVTVFALLDSPSVAGAYEFVIHPGLETAMEVRSVLIPRQAAADVGIAPLTSMYWFAALEQHRVNDHRGAVHDSDGLAMFTGKGERIWRPLANPAAVETSIFSDDAPRGFGLVQRARDFAHYLDTEARYNRRPSAWVEPRGNWGPGAVVLVEIPTRNEFHDNIVAFWRPREPLAPGVAHRFDYRLTWSALPPETAALAQVVASRGGLAVNHPSRRIVTVDFDLGDRSMEGLTVEASATRGAIDEALLVPLPIPQRARVTIHLTPPPDGAAELRLRLLAPDGSAASETWLYRWVAS